MLVTRLVRGMQLLLGCALLFGGAYFAWQKRAEFSALKPEQKIGAEVFNERLAAVRMLSGGYSLDESSVRRDRKPETRRSHKSEVRGRGNRHETVGRG